MLDLHVQMCLLYDMSMCIWIPCVLCVYVYLCIVHVWSMCRGVCRVFICVCVVCVVVCGVYMCVCVCVCERRKSSLEGEQSKSTRPSGDNI